MDCVNENLTKELALSGTMICLEARSFAREMDIDDFRGSIGWSQAFHEGHSLVVCACTHIAQ